VGREAGDSDFWVGALFINQQSGVEKSAQVSMRGDIYSQTDRVLSWLGPLLNDEHPENMAGCEDSSMGRFFRDTPKVFRIDGITLEIATQDAFAAACAFRLVSRAEVALRQDEQERHLSNLAEKTFHSSSPGGAHTGPRVSIGFDGVFLYLDPITLQETTCQTSPM
jgi:hypothetical protein